MSLPSNRKPRLFLIVFLLISMATFAGFTKFNSDYKTNCAPQSDTSSADTVCLYNSLQLEKLGLSRKAYDYAMQGMNQLKACGKLKNNQILSIIDFSLSSCKKRLFILDVASGKLLFQTIVSHGRNSGKEMATAFSNSAESFQSSLGFYVTGDTYTGEHGLSLRLLGEEKGINDNALARGIVMHCAAYVNEALVKSQGYIGRSLGCPALPEGLHKTIIDKIKNGTCLFVYSPDKYYFSHSKIIPPPVS